ncbi:MAG: hypothetical protein PHU85_08670 [Phycisphaerae bacterium]|nr:hypothetical protein [Phycisphaerae bacterium]
MSEHSAYQKKVIQRYYDNIESISLQKLAELVSELYMETSEKKAEKLWQRVSQAMTALKVPEKVAMRLMAERDVQLLASHLQDWMSNPPK